jgi:asparagine N-glycosylation enzyme membrane subunit Stt3
VEQKTSSRITALALILFAAISFVLRVLPSYHVAFTRGIVNFQEPDAWFHVRTVHNLLAHFPKRSGFDPYVLFPGGQNNPTAPVWDYMLAIPAWILGLGAPSPVLIDWVAAWMPALLGALFPIPAFFLARRLFGTTAGILAALWVATCYGAFVWITHLGLADHHAAEAFFAFLTLTWMCAAIDAPRSRHAWLAGIAMGLFLGTRPAGIFVPAILACLVVVEPVASGVVLRAVVAASVVFLLAAGSLWSEYTWLSLAVAGGLAACVWALDTLGERRVWPAWIRRVAPFGLLAVGAAAILLAKPHLLGSLWFEIRRVAGLEEASRVAQTVQEMQPIYRAGPVAGWISVFQTVGLAPLFAIPMLVQLLLRPERPAVRLLALWGLVMTSAAIMQVRMAIYFAPVASVLAGAICAQLIEWLRPGRGRVLTAIFAVLILAINVPFGVHALRSDQGVNADWLAAFDWLRTNTPDPVAEAGAWTSYYPAVPPNTPHMQGAWGVAVWWDRAYELEQLSRRIPMTNGTQTGAEDMARFYTETIPEAAVAWLRHLGARYVVVDPQSPWFAGENRSRFPAQVRMLGHDPDGYMQMLAKRSGGTQAKTLPVYLPAYYQTMAARLYLGNGEAMEGTGPWVFETEPTQAGGKTVDLVVASRHFESEDQAADYLKARRYAHLTVGCTDPARSCMPLPAVKGLRLVYASNQLPIDEKSPLRAVKIFEVLPEDR